jgi:hypothetical protein
MRGLRAVPAGTGARSAPWEPVRRRRSRNDCGAERAPRAAREAECAPVRIRTATEASAESRFGAGAANAARGVAVRA